MPPFPGEETLATLYIDIHYYFTQPTIRPVLHRFDKASYFYIYYNSTRQTSRIEIANNPGTPEQDAFNGFLDSCHVINSHKFPTLLTLVVDGNQSNKSPTSTSRPGRDSDEWRLASADPRDPGKNKYRLHTLDIYFWQQDDAKLVTDLFKKLLNSSQLDVVELLEESSGQHEEPVNHVVQNLEHVAISDPAYQKGKTRNSQSQAANQPINLPPPPPPPGGSASDSSQLHTGNATSVSPMSGMTDHDRKQSTKREEPTLNYTPMAYNPAAPAAPEPIAHREDTPPPPDDGTSLAAAALHDNQYGHIPQSPPYTGMPGAQAKPYGQFGSIPQSQTMSYGSLPPSQQQQQQQQMPPRTSISSGAPSFAPPPVNSPSPSHRHGSVAAQHYVPTSPDPQTQMYIQQPPVQTPGTQFYASINENHVHKPLQHVQPQYADYLTSATSPPPPIGGYSQYQYNPSSSPPQQAPQGNAYDVHSQVYRPTETEAHHHHHHHQQQQQDDRPGRQGSSSTKPSKFDQRADKVEKSVGRLFKKIEKRIG